jgi:hypothetical protein
VTETEERRAPTGAAPSTTPTGTANSTSSPAPIAGLLDTLSYTEGERLGLSWLPDGGQFISAVIDPSAAAAVVAALPEGDVWFGVNPTNAPYGVGVRRGDATQVTRLAAVWADLDVKPGACQSKEQAHTIVAVLSDLLGVAPAVVVDSGHGLQPYWPIEPEDGGPLNTDERRGKAAALLRRWGRLVKLVAQNHGADADNVFDLPRVLRVPGTVNRKADPVPVTATAGAGGPITVASLGELLDSEGVDERETDREIVTATTPPVSDPQGWGYTDAPCRYADRVIAGWATDTPAQRHPWLLSQATRIAAMHRKGCLTPATHKKAVDALGKRFAELCARPGDTRPVKRFELAEAIDYGIRLAARMYDDKIAAELGGHMHLAQMAGNPDTATPASDTDDRAEIVQLRRARTPAEQAAALEACQATFRACFGDDYDLDALGATLATLAVERLEGDPIWLLIVSGSGNAKTETACSARDVEAVHIVSSIASEGALLSATSKRERTAEASGGLLRQIGPRGTLVVKDVTTILSMDRTARGQVLAALREIYDGTWVRNVGTDGGRTLKWSGRIAFIGAVTTAWDTHHAVVATMGDRFVLLRTSSRQGRITAGRQAIRNTGSEKQMRADLAAAVADVLAGVGGDGVELSDDEVDRLLAAADLVTLARTAVEYDYQGRPIQAHEPEMPTRFAKQLSQVLRGAVAVGLARADALRLALRCARDSMPPVRLAILDHLNAHPAGEYTSDVRKGINLPYTTVDRQLQGLHMLGVLDCTEVEYGAERHRWLYRLAEGVDPSVLTIPERPESSPDLLVGGRSGQVGGGF